MSFPNRLFYFLLAVYVILIATNCSNFNSEQCAEEIEFDYYDVDVYSPFFGGYDANSVCSWSNSIENAHPLDLGRKAMFSLFHGNENNDTLLLENGKQILEFLMEYPYVFEDSTSIVFSYSFDHKSLVKGEWWSGMANAAIAQAFYFGYEIFGEKVYYDYFYRSMNGVIEAVSNNGSALNTSDSATWFLEYVHQNSTVENSYFVLNGFLFQLLATDIIYKRTKNEIYKEAFNRGLNAFKETQSAFYFNNLSWTYYMLNPLTIESVHYCIYDILLLKSLYKSTNEPFFKEEIFKRSYILKQNFPISKLSYDTYDVYNFSSIGPPHPYWIDTYQIELRYFSDNKLIYTDTLPKKDFSIPVKIRGFLVDTFPTDKMINYIGVYAIYNKDTIQLYGVNAENIEKTDKNSWFLKSAVTKCNRDLTRVNDSVFSLEKQSPNDSTSLTRGTLSFHFEDLISISNN